jgi:NAD(P)-dependent dehydrogenase (short-subunit alcohol dehydrogenase family)
MSMIYASSMSLDARVAVVTGGARGIGRAIAARLAAGGARVVVTARDLAAAEAAAAAVGGHGYALDVRDRAAVASFAAAVSVDVGPVDVLVANAGVAESAPLAKTDDAAWDEAMAVNATAPFLLCRAFVPAMQQRRRGRVVVVASNAGLTGYAYTSAYCASKHAVVGLVRALAIEVARSGVTVNAVCPGFVDTDMTRHAVARIAATTKRTEDEARAALEAMSPQRRLVRADEVASLVATLCADESGAINGQAIALDGGQVMK